MYLEFTYRLPRFFTITLLAAQAVLVGLRPIQKVMIPDLYCFESGSK